MPLAAGARLGPYEILGSAGTGGMSEVYRARDTRLGRIVAIKLLPTEIRLDEDRRHRLQREAQAIAALNHPRICALHDLSSKGDVEFLVMEYLEGETLAQRLKRGPLPVADSLRVGAEVGEALTAAHRAGIVHRDIKPSNVMLTRTGAKLLDFGIAKQPPRETTSIGQDTTTATLPGTPAGTLPYMAPEQLRGEDVDGRTDIFAFGAVLFETITGERAFAGTSPAAVAAAILGTSPPPPSQVRPAVPASVDRVVAACLSPDPDDRWQSIGDVVRELRWIEGDIEGRREGRAAEPRSRPWRVHAAWATLASALAVALAILAWPQWRAPNRVAVAPPNPRPVVLLMDSALPGRVYDARTEKAGGTNADDLTDALRDLPVVIQKETTSAMWHREAQVLAQNPDLIVSHLSCLLDERFAERDTPLEEHLFGLAENRLVLFFGYVATVNPRTQFLVYSRRSAFRDPATAKQWREGVEARMPALRSRLHTFSVPAQERATFRDPETARVIRQHVARILGLA